MFEIGMDPDLLTIGGAVLSWHGLFSFVGVVLAVFLVARWAPKQGISSDAVYGTAIWAIIAGILGARLVHVIDEWSFYSNNPGQIIALWQGGIAIWGAVLGGFVGGAIYAKLNRIPVGRLADITAPAMLLAMAVGRIGDVINGEHVGKFTSMPWGIIWSHPKSPSFQLLGPIPTHPIPFYEILVDLLSFALVWWVLRRRLKPDGMLFGTYLALYAFGRFFIDFFKQTGASPAVKAWVAGLTEAQLISVVVVVVLVPLVAYRARWTRTPVEPEPVAPTEPRAVRRRRAVH
ncbi:MAG: prolipoprotein diacylglyceryl transferase [Chloroflexi bacterium]|nr:prolipoprotein diacylglyceryl transferase [Chloroflexota bacterium]